jgi:hypothetical protein
LIVEEILPFQTQRPRHPAPAALPLLGSIADFVSRGKLVEQSFRRPPNILTVLPGEQCSSIPNCGWTLTDPPELSGDATQQSDTSLHYRDGKPINANRVPYFVLPLPTSWPKPFGIALGDIAAVVFGGRLAFAVFADFGPRNLLGEGSVELFRELGEERVRSDGRVRDIGMGPGVIRIVFPKSGASADRDSEAALVAAVKSRGLSLFRSLGGVPPAV